MQGGVIQDDARYLDRRCPRMPAGGCIEQVGNQSRRRRHDPSRLTIRAGSPATTQ